MEWTDLYMPLSQFNRLLTGCGWEPVELDSRYLLVTDVQGICDIDFSERFVTLNGETYTFTVESYLCDNTTDVYKAVTELEIGDKIDMEGFLYWYEGVNPHITSVTEAE